MIGASAAAGTALLPAVSALARERGPLLVELFTSQGCDSCPPADALLTDLCKRKDVFPLSLHVDYWDYIGWADPFAALENTTLQRAYARTFGRRTIYTPQMVIGGIAEGVGSRRRDMMRLIDRALEDRSPGVAVELDMEAATVALRPIGGRPRSGADVYVVTFDRQHETDIRRGENRGKKLVHSNVQRSRVRIAGWDGEIVKLALPFSPPRVAHTGVGVIVQQQQAGPVLGAAMHSPWAVS